MWERKNLNEPFGNFLRIGMDLHSQVLSQNDGIVPARFPHGLVAANSYPADVRIIGDTFTCPDFHGLTN